MFAAIVGRALKYVAKYKLEHGATIGVCSSLSTDCEIG
jgi:hypothetical protein